MGRPSGSRNKDFDEERGSILGRVARVMGEPAPEIPSFRELARVSEVSPATLRHYFPSRDALLAEAMTKVRGEGAAYVERLAAEPLGEVQASLRWALGYVVEGWRFGVRHVLGFGLSAGLGNEVVGPACVDALLEPMLQGIERRIAAHVARGDLADVDPRYAALALLSPVLLALIHQEGLGGVTCRPLALEPFVDAHVAHFLAGYASRVPAGRAPRGRRAPRGPRP